jgi:hypothetical protein
MMLILILNTDFTASLVYQTTAINNIVKKQNNRIQTNETDVIDGSQILNAYIRISLQGVV